MEKNIEKDTETVADEELPLQSQKQYSSPLIICKCLLNERSSEQIAVSERKKLILSTAARTEKYLHERRIPELISFLLTKIIARSSSHPAAYLESLLDDCMLYRAGLGVAPVLYEDRHLQAVIKSFDPGNRGWLTAGQIRRAFNTLGLTPKDIINERVSSDEVLRSLKKTQESELYRLLSAGDNINDEFSLDES